MCLYTVVLYITGRDNAWLLLLMDGALKLTDIQNNDSLLLVDYLACFVILEGKRYQQDQYNEVHNQAPLISLCKKSIKASIAINFWLYMYPGLS